MKYGTLKIWLLLSSVLSVGGKVSAQTEVLIDTGLLDAIRVVEDPEGESMCVPGRPWRVPLIGSCRPVP